MGAEQILPLWQPLSKQFYQLCTLTRELENLQRTKTALTNQLHAFSHSQFNSKTTQRRLLAMIRLLDKQLESIQKEVGKLVESDAELKRKLAHITLIKGAGLMSAVTVIAETNGFALFENQKQLVSYAGYDVVENQSGKRTGRTRISKKGNSHIRRILHMPSLNVVRFGEPAFKTFFDRLISNGKKKMQAYVAVQKKLLVLMYTLWKNDQPFCRITPAASGLTSGDKEPVPLFPVVSGGNSVVGLQKSATEKEVAPASGATQDELLYDKSPEALFPVGQSY
jgi:transposase